MSELYNSSGNDTIVIKPRDFLPKQQEILDAMEKPGIKYILYSGAYGAGKTLLICNAVIRECIKHPKSLWFYGAQTVPMIRDTVVRTFLEEIDKYQEEFNKAGIDIKITDRYMIHTMNFKFWNGSEVLFRSCDEPSKYKSLNLDGVALDEPVDIDEQVFLMLQGRLRATHGKKRMCIMAGNPAGRMNWVYQTFIEKKRKEYFWVHTTTYDNSFLPADYIKSCEENFDEDYGRRYLYGEWGSFSGQIYKDFNYKKHVGDYIRRECQYHIAGFDDGTRNPACFLVVGVDSDKNMYIKEELYEAGLVDSEKTELIDGLCNKYHIQKVFIDPSALSMSQALKNRRIRVANANNDVETGISKLKSFFKNDIVYIDKNCKNLIKELESYRYGKDRDSKNKTELPIKKDDHAVDALRYSITNFNPFRRPTYCSGVRR